VDKLEKHSWHYKLKRQREIRGWSRARVAEGLDIDIKTISRWERGETFPQSRYRQNLVELFEANAVDLGLVEDEDTIPSPQAPVSQHVAQDWGEAPHIDACYGRQQESATLQHWILDEHCSMIAVLGIGGIGKTTFTTMLARQISNEFAYVIWRSLQNAPPVEQIIASCLQFAPAKAGREQALSLHSGSPSTGQGNPSADLNKQFTLLCSFLREHRCLIILDNVESIFETGQRAGRYANHYDGYGRFFQLLGEAEHQSCLLLTSREKPKEMIHMEGKTSRVRTFPLAGISEDDGQHLLEERELFGSPGDWKELIHTYSGNPLALKLVAQPIRELFNGDIAGFLAGEEIVLGDIHDLIAQQFQRLTPPEKHMLYSLAIEREPISRSDLLENMRLAYPKYVVLLDALESLRRRSLVEISERESGDKSEHEGWHKHQNGASPPCPYITLQPVIREYVTSHFVEQISQEILEAGSQPRTISTAPTQLHLLNTQPVLKALAKDYIRQSQERQVVEPILQNLRQALGLEDGIAHLKNLLASLHKTPQYKNGYTAGSLLNLLTHFGADLRGLDCSRLTIRQAYLQGFALPEVNFQGANLAPAVFTDTFSSILCVAVSADGQMLAAGTTTNEVRLWVAGQAGHFYDGLVPLLTSQQASAQTLSPHTRSNGQFPPQPGPQTAYSAVLTQGHTDGIRAVAFHPGGHLLASGSEDQTIRLWDTDTGECIAVLSGHTNWVRSIAFSPDGSLLASGSEDQTVRLWNVNTGTCCQVLQGHTQRVRAVAFSPQGNVLASGGDDGTIRLWNTGTWTWSHILEEQSSHVRALAFHPTKEILASGSEERTIRLWDTLSGTCLSTLRGHAHRISALTFAADGMVLASSSDDLTIRLWDCQDKTSPSLLRTLNGHTNRIWSLASVPGRRTFVSAAEDRTLRIWNITGSERNTLISVAEDQTLRVWDMTSGACIRTLRGHTSLIKAIAYSPDGHLIASATEEQIIHLWDVESRHCLHTMHGHSNRIRAIAFSPDGRLLASGSEDETIRLWNVASGSCLRTLTGHTHLVRGVAFSPDGRTLVSCSYDQTIRLWQCSTGQNYQTLRGHHGTVWTVAVSHDGTIIASGGDDTTTRLWNIDTGECFNILTGHSHRVWCVTFSPDDTLIASTSDDGSIRIWERATGRCIQILDRDKPGVSEKEDQAEQKGHTAWTRTISFSPDGCFLASGSHDQTVCIWDVASGQCRCQLVGHTNVVWSVAFSPTQPILASAGDDGTIRLWHSPTGEYLKMVGEERLCEHMNITDTIGLSTAQKQTLLSLGAINANEL
jgi:WD40 repeat protein/transcriptional regulator with XRE-family HTH domain